jgi:hypothetical protein
MQTSHIDKVRDKQSWYILLLPLALLLLLGLAVVAYNLQATGTQQPGTLQISTPQPESTSPSSELVGSFVQQTDGVYGYRILRPAAWDAINLGDVRGYRPAGSDGKDDRVLLTVTNVEGLGRKSTQNLQIVTYNQFKQNPSLEGWTQAIERHWQSLGISFNQERKLSNAIVYSTAAPNGQIQLVGYVVDNGKPLVASLHCFGSYSNRGKLVRDGLLKDFETMVASLTALDGTSQEVSPPLP